MDKQVTFYVVDASKSMLEVHKDREITDVEYVSKYVLDEMANRVLYDRVSDKVGVIIGDQEVVSIDTPNQENIGAVKDMARSVPISAGFEQSIINALGSIQTHCRKLKFSKKIVAFTNKIPDNPELLAQIHEMNKTFGVSLMLALIDVPAESIEQLPDATVVPYDDVAQTISAAKPKVIKPIHVYKGQLTLGSPEKSQLAFDIAVYPATKRATAPTAHWVYGPDGQQVKQLRGHLVEGQAVEKDTLETGHLFGSEIVLFDRVDETMISGGGPIREPGLEIIGFVSEVPAYMPVGSSNYVLETGSRSDLGISALARSLYERELVALARFVRRSGSDIEMVSLQPLITQEVEGLLMNILPFAQDCLALSFNSLEADERQPTAEMQELMDNAVDDMEIDFDSQSVANPYNHRIANFLKQRGAGLDTELHVPLPEPVSSGHVNKAFVDAFDIQKVDRSATESKDKENLESTAGDLDLDELLK